MRRPGIDAVATGPLPLTGPHWSFSVGLYRRPGVAEACLWLQDALEVDVNIALFVLYAASEGGMTIAGPDLRDLDESVASWRGEVVRTLRVIRRHLKHGPAPGPQPETEALRDTVKRAELQAEQIELAALAQWLAGHAATLRTSSMDMRQLLIGVAERFAPPGRIDALAPELDRALDTILGELAAMRREAPFLESRERSHEPR